MQLTKNIIGKIPKDVTHVTSVLEDAGFEAYMVGGSVRDLLMGRDPKDWDITTNATPEQIIPLFEKTVYENTFGTVGVCLPVPHETNKESVSRETSDILVTHETKGKVSPETTQKVPHETIHDVPRVTPEYLIVEVTPYRIEAKYSDFRHPDEVKFSDKLEDDLKRRDFTVNAMALDSKGNLTDIYKGQEDIKDKVLRTVGEPDDRFGEDALRMLRAVRFACQLGFSISHETSESILKNCDLLKKISTERIRDEFEKIIMSESPASGVLMLQKFGLLKHIIPELEEGIKCEQGGAHIYDVWDHLLMALQHAADKKWPLEIRIAALFHDIGKPRTRRPGERKAYTFYGHEVVGARMARKIMDRLKFPKKESELVETLVRMHMFFSDTEQITLSAVRRIITRVGKENIWLLMNIRECDRVGMKKKEAPYRLRKYFAMVEQALRDPISVKQLKIDGNYLMNTLHMKPGPRMGWVLNALLEEVLEDPEKNEIEYLKNKVSELEKLDDSDLKNLGEKGKEAKEELEDQEIEKLHSKHGVSSGKK
ncbi:MAG: HD domain-containing protein [Candidatus Pacebacteria bacterium]|nr:HD domain-containing protein [Candidatus Paceibacterota bacterium]MBP9851088.1 HD domain-containing protein [Candidatus Paceibacterota bacterium]